LEQLLNLVWLGIACVVLCALVARRRPAGAAGALLARPARLVVAVAAMAILFPCISASDDLAQTPPAAEAAFNAGASASPAADRQQPVVKAAIVSVPALVGALAFSVALHVVPGIVAAPGAGSPLPVDPRGPPSPRLAR
jgi:hypothetical protein